MISRTIIQNMTRISKRVFRHIADCSVAAICSLEWALISTQSTVHTYNQQLLFTNATHSDQEVFPSDIFCTTLCVSAIPGNKSNHLRSRHCLWVLFVGVPLNNSKLSYNQHISVSQDERKRHKLEPLFAWYSCLNVGFKPQIHK